MTAFAQRPASSGSVKGRSTADAEEMSTAAAPTVPSSQLTPDQLSVIAASISALVFSVVLVVLVAIVHYKDPRCCRFRPHRGTQADMDAPPQYHNSRQTLVGSPGLEPPQITNDSNAQAGQLFYVSLASSYCLPSLEAPMPRLPSYESVRKKDRQRQIHMMIADRFGLSGPIVNEPPPTYEESVQHSMELPYNILLSSLDASCPPSFCTNTGLPVQTDTAHPVPLDTNSSVLPV
ncbi:uncharacterized protein KZ484_005082 [Pholidichthys leucotaenia]